MTVIHKQLFEHLTSVGAARVVMLGGQPIGIGKRTVARQIADTFAKQVNHFDRLDKVTLSAIEIREAVHWAEVRPFSGYKLLLLNCDTISSNGFNSLLKLIEEPPNYLRIILTYSDRSRIPVTVFSRCLHFIVPRMTQEQVVECLANKGMLKQKAAQLAHSAEGSVTLAEQLMDLEGKAAAVIGAVKYLIDRKMEIFLLQATKWRDELIVLEQLMLFVKRWKYCPFPVAVFPIELIATLSKLTDVDIDRIIEIISRPIRPSLKVFAFAEIITTGRKERF